MSWLEVVTVPLCVEDASASFPVQHGSPRSCLSSWLPGFTSSHGPFTQCPASYAFGRKFHKMSEKVFFIFRSILHSPIPWLLGSLKSILHTLSFYFEVISHNLPNGPPRRGPLLSFQMQTPRHRILALEHISGYRRKTTTPTLLASWLIYGGSQKAEACDSVFPAEN